VTESYTLLYTQPFLVETDYRVPIVLSKDGRFIDVDYTMYDIEHQNVIEYAYPPRTFVSANNGSIRVTLSTRNDVVVRDFDDPLARMDPNRQLWTYNVRDRFGTENVGIIRRHGVQFDPFSDKFTTVSRRTNDWSNIYVHVWTPTGLLATYRLAGVEEYEMGHRMILPDGLIVYREYYATGRGVNGDVDFIDFHSNFRDRDPHVRVLPRATVNTLVSTLPTSSSKKRPRDDGDL
jgi:hypothetical protein